MWQELFEVVSGVEWLLTRAQMDPLGLVLDLEHAAKQKCEFGSLVRLSLSPSQQQQTLILHRTVKLMAQALRMDLQELQHDYRSVPSQLVGRLLAHESESTEMQGLLTKLREWEGPMPQGWWGKNSNKTKQTNEHKKNQKHKQTTRNQQKRK